MDRLQANGAEFEYETAGEGEPLVLIHGSIIGEAFKPLLGEPSLTGSYRVISYHRRGFCGSTKHGGPFSIAQQAADALAVINAVAGGRAQIAGHSYGAATALQLALDAPAAVHSLALLEPPLPLEGSVVESEGMEAVDAAVASGDRGAMVDAFLDLALGPGEWREASNRHLPANWRDQAIADIDTFFEVELPAHAEWQFNAAHARRITQPVLSVVGELSDPSFREVDAFIAREIPHAEHFVLPRASHGLQYMNPRDMAERLAAFLAKHPMPAAARA